MGGAILIRCSTSIGDKWFVNLAPEFWHDFRRKLFRAYVPLCGTCPGATRKRQLKTSGHPFRANVP